MGYIKQLKELLTQFKNQSELASELRVSNSTLSKWLSEEHVPHLKKILTIDLLHKKFCNMPGQITLDDVI